MELNKLKIFKSLNKFVNYYLFIYHNFPLFKIQTNFNKHLSETRQVIERAFALLKRRFRRLKYLHMTRIDLIPETILACCILHNVCLEHLDEDIEDYILDDEIVNNEIDIEDNNEEVNAEGNMESNNKRDYIAQTLYMLD